MGITLVMHRVWSLCQCSLLLGPPCSRGDVAIVVLPALGTPIQQGLCSAGVLGWRLECQVTRSTHV